jgi:sarcosine oxidase, subunit alpha
MNHPLSASLGRVDRSQTLHFTFDGRALTGFAGDTLASALLRNGIHLVGRSFKYHRPRGILAAGSEEPNALVSVRRDDARYTPNLRATQVELYDGLEVHSQNRWPSLSWDFGGINSLLSPFIPAGFYYKTFMWPRGAWKSLYEPRIRAAAGLGKSPTLADPDRYTNRFAHCDVLVVGAGPAGLSAALAAASSGAKVIICDEQPEFGGSLLSEPAGSQATVSHASDAHAAASHTTADSHAIGALATDPRAANIEGVPASTWLARAIDTLKNNPRVTVLPRTNAFGYFPHNMVGLNERLTDHVAQPHPDSPRERQWQVRAKEVVLAAGAIERPLVFPGNDRPGIMLAGAARTYVNRYGAVPGSRAVVITACDEAYRAALDLHEAGVFIAIIADIRAKADGPLVEAARHAGLPVQTSTTIVGTSGRLRVDTVRLARVDDHGHVTDGEQIMPCDLVLMSGGFTPTVHLFSQSRGKLTWDDKTQSFIPGQPAERARCAGACRGVYSLAAVLNDGSTAGAAAATAASTGPTLAGAAITADVAAFATGPGAASNMHASASATTSGAFASGAPADPPIGAFAGALPQPGGTTGSMAFVDWQNDVTTKDLALATREGFRSVEHIKRYTTTGMATDQGKTSNLNALGFVSRELGKAIPEVGLTTFRMPYTPVSFASFAGFARGSLFDPIRRTPTHDWAARNGAVFEDVGLWKRAHYFPRSTGSMREDMHAAVARECVAVRKSVGMFDASTLGKVEVVGKDAVTFMNRMYVNGWTSLAVGRSRYGVLLRDDGFVYDDGVVARTAENRFHVTTTTGGAAGVLRLMEDYLQTEWPDLDVWLTSISEQWSVIAVQGPNSRRVLEKLVEGIDMTAQAMPHMSVARGRICGAPMLLFRVSFTGELGFEVNVPADFGQAVWEAIYAAGQQYDITPYGTEAMHVLRAEKGYIIVGQETDGTVTPDDAGLGWAIGKTKPDFVGKRSLQRPSMSADNRKQLVGLFTADPQVVLDEGSQVMLESGQKPPVRPIGHVTSSYHSAVLGRSIALALVSGGRARTGETLYVPTGHGDIAVKVTSPVFYDPEGARLNG